MLERVADLTHIVRWDAGRHADGDAGRTICQEIGEVRGKNDGLIALAVVCRTEVDSVFVDPFQQRGGDVREAGLGVSHRRRVIAIDVAEIALAVDQRITRREILCQAHERVIDRAVPMRMELTNDVADDAGTLLVALPGVEAKLAHGVEQAAVDRLQSVAHVRQRPGHDRAQRVAQIALAQSFLKRCRSDLAGLFG